MSVIVDTAAARMVWRECDEARQTADVVIVSGPPGSGKTSTLLAYAEHHVDRTVLYRTEVINTPRSLVRSLLHEVGYIWNGRTREGLALLSDTLRQRKIRLLLVDDAQRLASHTLDMLRTVHEACPIGIVLVGTPRGAAMLLARCPELAHKARRGEAIHSMGRSDLERISDPYAVSPLLNEKCGGNPYRLLQLLRLAKARARRRHRSLTKAIVVQTVLAFDPLCTGRQSC